MEIRVPIDVLVLQELSSGEHANPIRVRYLINRDHMADLRAVFGVEEVWLTDYIQQRMSRFEGVDILDQVPPDTAGLYRISPAGHALLRMYLETEDTEFGYAEIMARADGVDTSRVERTELPWVNGE